jgi:hypothetical protein
MYVLIWSVMVSFFNRRRKRLLKAVMVPALSMLLILSSFAFAFGDFVPVTTYRVLGVGRIQSTPAAAPVASEEKFALATRMVENASAEQPTELAEPIAREVAVVEVEPTPPPVVEQPPAASGPSVSVEDGSWIVTKATNYATPGDNFLGKTTASGALTTTTSMGVAHKNLPLGTQIEIYCPRSGLSCIATVNDRGPYDGRPDTFDFQMGVTAALGNNTGWYEVHYRVIS